jgi:hypothetical protein
VKKHVQIIEYIGNDNYRISEGYKDWDVNVSMQIDLGNWIWDESDESDELDEFLAEMASDESDESTDLVEKRRFTKYDLIDMIANPAPNSVLANLARTQYSIDAYNTTLEFLKSSIN